MLQRAQVWGVEHLQIWRVEKSIRYWLNASLKRSDSSGLYPSDPYRPSCTVCDLEWWSRRK